MRKDPAGMLLLAQGRQHILQSAQWLQPEVTVPITEKQSCHLTVPFPDLSPKQRLRDN